MESAPNSRRQSGQGGSIQQNASHVFDELTDSQKLSYSLIDPFHPFANIENPFLYYATCRNGSATFSLELPELKSMRRQGYSIWLRGMPKTIVKNERQKWPNEIRVYVNMTLVSRIEPPKRLKKRRDEPIELTVFLQSGKNHIQISVGDTDNASQYSVAIVVCGTLTDKSVISSVLPQSIDSSKERLISIMSVKSELISDTVEGWRNIDLKCPISLDKISIPVRGTQCNHIRCFDLGAYVGVNRSTSNINLRWICPICYQQVFPRDLIIDTYIESIIQSTPGEVCELLICESNAEWKLGELAPPPLMGEKDEGGEETYVTRDPNDGHDSDATQEEEDFYIDTVGNTTGSNREDSGVVLLLEDDEEEVGTIQKSKRSKSSSSEATPLSKDINLDVIELD